MTAAPTPCPEPDVLAQYVEDGLVAELRLTLEDHIDGCDDCRSTVSVLVGAAGAERRASGPAIIAGDPAMTLALEPTAIDPERPSSRAPHRAPQSPLAAGTAIGRYVIGAPLGIGGMGIVYSARDPDLGRDIAIKVLRPEFARAHPDAARRIVREAQAMARVAHPNVVAVFDVGTFHDRVFVAMERVTGTNLRDWLAKRSRSPAEILAMFTAAGRGLIAAHDAGMVHRDFKPDNVLVGEDGRARVTDFGLAFDESDGGSDADSELVSHPIAGTPAYMAPEQHAGGNLDARTDQFSFAVALHEALYGKRPFTGATRDALAGAVGRGEVDPPPAGSRVPSSLRAIVVRALSVKPGNRFPSMSELLLALGRDRTRRPRRIALIAAIGLIVVGVATGVGFAADLISRDRTTAVTRARFAATRGQLEKLVGLRTEAFVAQSDALYRLPAVEEVAQTRDLADFGLGDAAGDRRRLENIHANLSSADWVALTRTRTDVFAISDAKGRLMFGTADSDVWGADVTAIPVLGAAYSASVDTSIGVIDGGDPAVVASGLLGGKPQPGLYVLFARAKRIGPRPRAMFVQAIRAARLLEEVSVGDDARLSLLDPDGHAEGSVPQPVVTATGAGIAELVIGDQRWLAERTPLRSGEQRDAFVDLVLARETEAGLGLFPHAGLFAVALATLLAAIAIGGLVVARRLDLGRAT